MAATPKRDTASEPPPAAETPPVIEPAAGENPAPPARPEPTAEELERLRRKLIAKFH
jgi:hypothetical protein